MRSTKTRYYLKIAMDISTRGTCIRRNYGAIIVKNDEIISTGYTGSPRGWSNCLDLAQCYRNDMGFGPGERYDLCRSVHAEQNAIISAARRDMIGATMYVSGISAQTGETLANFPCHLCVKMIINAGIKRVILTEDTDISVDMLNAKMAEELEAKWKQMPQK